MKRIGLLVAVVALVSGAAFTARAQSGKVKVSQNPPPATELSLVQTGNGGYLGVFLGDVNAERAKELKLTEVRGAVVGEVVKGSPAERAGLRADDVILSYNEERVNSAAQLHRLLSETPPGRQVVLGISRDGARQNITVAVGERSVRSPFGFKFGGELDTQLMYQEAERMRQQAEEMRRKLDAEGARRMLEESESLRQQAETMRAEIEQLRREGKLQGFDGGRGFYYRFGPGRYYLGVKTTPLNEQLAKFFNVKGGSGLLVTEVEPKSPAERAGLKAGDCIISVNGERVTSEPELRRLIGRPGKDEKESSESTLTIVRERNEQTIKVTPERRD